MVITGAAIDPETLVLQVGHVANWLKAIGIAAIIWLIFESIALWFDYKRWKNVNKIMADMKRLEDKLDKIARKK